MATAELSALKTTMVYPAQVRVPKCPKCGARQWRLPAWFIEMFSMAFTSFDVAYCEGSKGATQTVSIPIFGGVAKTEVDTICAGVAEEHLHVRCRRCHFFFMQHVPGVEPKGWKAAEEIAGLKGKVRTLVADRDTIDTERAKALFERDRLARAVQDYLEDPVPSRREHLIEVARWAGAKTVHNGGCKES